MIFKRAEKYVSEYRQKERDLIRLKRSAKVRKNFHVESEPTLAFVIRIRGYVNKKLPNYSMFSFWNSVFVVYIHVSNKFFVYFVYVKLTTVFLLNSIKLQFKCYVLPNHTLHGAIQIWNQFENLSTNVALAKSTNNVYLCPIIVSSKKHLANKILSVLKISSMKSSVSERISKKQLTFFGHSNSTTQRVGEHRIFVFNLVFFSSLQMDGERKRITLLMEVISVIVNNISINCYVKWFKHIIEIINCLFVCFYSNCFYAHQHENNERKRINKIQERSKKSFRK